MLRSILEARTMVALFVAAGVGTWGLHAYPVRPDEVFLALIEVRKPLVFQVLVYGYAALWFTTPYYMALMIASLVTIIVYRRVPAMRSRPLPPYPGPEKRSTPMLVLGESHHHTTPGRAPQPAWLTIPQRGLYTGVMVLGAVGTGKTSACMYPYVDQLLRWRSEDPQRKVGGLVLEVKGDFCGQVRSILSRAGRADDFLEIGLDTGVCYNPLHNDLDPYAVAYAIATLLNNLFGRSKEPFWQQAYTDLLKFVILLRRITDGYTTFSEIYQYILDDGQIQRDIDRLKAELKNPPDVIIVPREEHRLHCTQLPWRHWFSEGESQMAHPYEAALEIHLDEHHVPFEVRKPQRNGWQARQHQLDAVERWYLHGWSRLDTRLRSSITEGVVVFLSLFDDNPAVHRAFCPPRAAYADEQKPGEPRPLPPLDALMEAGKVLALNFPVGMNPGLARILGVMLKLDFQRAVLQRIPQITAHPRQVWRDLLFICDEYHAFATVGETDPTGDERTFALSRQAKLIPIVATQSISSLRSALPGDESWRTLMQCFRTKIFLATSDEFTAKIAAELCGRRDRLKAHYTISESGRDAHISLLTGRPTANRQSLSASKSYAPHHEYIFAPRLEEVARTLEVRNLTVAIKNIARACGDEISDHQPILDARLEDGSRVAAMFPPCSVDGPTLTVRKFTHRYTVMELVSVGTLSCDLAGELKRAVDDRKNILISGGTGTGKTTLLNALAATIPERDRIVLIEETSEILIEKPNLVRFEARRAQVPLGQETPLPAVTISDLVRATLRHRPDRILVGEVRGPEAFDLLQALNTGHLGSLSTIHANSAEQALTRLAHCVMTANVGLPHRSVREAIALAIHLVVHIARVDGLRKVTDVIAVRAYDNDRDRFALERV